MLHGDGQYAPECLPEIVAPLERGEADAVMGSRMMEPGAARRGGMPLYKYVGNRILTTFENKVLGHRSDRVPLRVPRLQRRCAQARFRSSATPTASTSTRRSSSSWSTRASGSSRCRSRPTTATRSATSTASSTPRTSRRMSSATASGRWASTPATSAASARSTRSSRATARTRRSCAGSSTVRRRTCSTSAAPAGLLSERMRALGHTVTGVDVLEIDGVRGSRRSLHPGRPRPRPAGRGG